MFIGRERGLSKLNALYQKDDFYFPVIYGIRRVKNLMKRHPLYLLVHAHF